MTRREIEDDIPILLEHYQPVVEYLDSRPVQNANKRKVTRRRVIDLYLASNDIAGTADRCGITITLVVNILTRAVQRARRLHAFSRA